jgi:hypothetical protein
MSTFAAEMDGDFRQAANAVETITRSANARSRLFVRLSAALHETRQREAACVIHRYRHLVPGVGQIATRTATKEADHGAY